MKNVAGRVIIFTVLGALAGLLTWVYSDLSGLIRFSDRVTNLSPKELQQNVLVLIAFGVLIATALGTADSVASGVRARWWLIPLIGIPVGFVAVQFGMTFFQLYRPQNDNPAALLWNELIRALAWGVMGALLGTADGWRKLSLRVGRNGALGGLVGGALGGAVFELIPYVLLGFSSPGIVSRLLGFVITGAAIGLFVALVQQLLREAWIEVVVGRNEGREYLVEKYETKIGRAELSDIPLFGNPAIARTHVVLLSQPNSIYVLHDKSGKPETIRVNNEPFTGERNLKSGDSIQIADRQLIFHERLTKAYTQTENRDRAVSKPKAAPISASSGLPSLSDLPQASGNGAMPTPFAPPVSSNYVPPVQNRTMGVPRLVATSGPYVGQTFPVQENAVAGRDATMTIPMPLDNKSSRSHARFVRDGQTGGFAVEDMGSTNGTYVNGQKIVRQSLVTGDTVVIGTTTFRYES